MSSEPVIRPGVFPRRGNVVAQTLREKLETLDIGRMTLQREREKLQRTLRELLQQEEAIGAEMVELREALSVFELRFGPVAEAEEEEESRENVPTRAVRRGVMWDVKDRERFAALGEPGESGQVKQRAISMVTTILQTMGHAHVRELHDMLRHQGVAISSAQRLSQILSESSEFEADRTKGWSLKR